MKKTANFYYDILSPFSYLFLKQRQSLEDRLELVPVPIFLPGILKIQNNMGPAEVPAKRNHTYEFCVWQASLMGVKFKMPRKHPFSSSAVQRLLLKHSADFPMLDKAFDFVWAQGGDVDVGWSEFCQCIGLSADTPKPTDEPVKTQLVKNTNEAAQSGVFGVPTVSIDNRIFFGCDSIDWIHQYLDDPNLFNNPEYLDVLDIENPLVK